MGERHHQPGSCHPDGVADLFGTSVDALLGYQLGGHTAQRRAAACKNALAARRLAVYQARRTEWQANPCADGKGAGGEYPGAACDNL